MTTKNHITEITRREVVDFIMVNNIVWHGDIGEVDFLNRIYPTEQMPSTDDRFSNAGGDIYQHRINNYDWHDDWIFHDARFELESGSDAKLLRFLCEMIHPAVRHDQETNQWIVGELNKLLEPDGYELRPIKYISRRPVYGFFHLNAKGSSSVQAMPALVDAASADYVQKQIERMEHAIETDPALAIGTAKELLESVCHAILRDRKIHIEGRPDLPKLVRATIKELKLAPDDIPESSKAADTIRRLLMNFATVADSMAQLRNSYGTGHGRDPKNRGLEPRHARLAAGAAATLAVFLQETHRARHDAQS